MLLALLAMWCVWTLTAPPLKGQGVGSSRFDDTIRQAWSKKATMVLSHLSSSATGTLFTVPEGKVLVLESVTLVGSSMIAQVTLSSSVDADEVSHRMDVRTNDNNRIFSLPAKCYVGPGKKLEAQVSYDNIPQLMGISFNMTGYLVDVIPNGQTVLKTDVNRDGNTNVNDAVAVLRRIVGLG